MRIAVIDDEKLTREELIRLIREDFPQAEVYEAGSGVQAMQLLEKKTFDFLFIDVRLGDMEGTTVASLARRLMPEAKIIFATAYSEYAVTAFELQANDYILKPYDPHPSNSQPVWAGPSGAERRFPNCHQRQPEAHYFAASGRHHLY